MPSSVVSTTSVAIPRMVRVAGTTMICVTLACGIPLSAVPPRQTRASRTPHQVAAALLSAEQVMLSCRCVRDRLSRQRFDDRHGSPYGSCVRTHPRCRR